MPKICIRTILSVGALTLGLSIHARANTITVTNGPFSNYGADGASSFVMGAFPATWTSTGNASILIGSVLNVNLEPTGITTAYADVDPGGSITETFLAPTKYYGFYWGSPDSYNTVTFVDSNGVHTVYGGGGTPVPGLILDQSTGHYVSFYDSGPSWISVTFTSEGIAFEFDNSTTLAPEPAPIVLLLGGLTAIGAGVVRRRRMSVGP